MEKAEQIYWLETNNTSWTMEELVEQFNLTDEEQQDLKNKGEIIIKREGYEEFENGFSISEAEY